MALRFSCNLLANRDSRTAVATQAAAGDEANNPLSTLTSLAAALTEGGSKTNKNVSSAGELVTDHDGSPTTDDG